MTTETLISIIGSIASIVAFFMAAPNAKSRTLHVAYAIILTFVVGISVAQNEKSRSLLRESEIRQNELAAELEALNELSRNAASILDSRESYVLDSETGKNRGFFLIGLGFLERNQRFFPELYLIAKDLAKGMKIAEPSGPLDYEERKRMTDGADAMAAILKGISQSER